MINESKIMVALLNMGGPKTNEDVKEFQKHLFNDARLIRFPLSFLLQGLFAWALVKFRLEAVKERYKLIGGGSPIYKSTENQVKALAKELNRRGRNIDVTYSFNYSPPYPTNTINQIQAANKEYILPLSLYPHYSKATTGSNMFYLKKAAQEQYPSLKFIETPSYHLHDGYIEAFVDRIQEALKPGESLDDFYLIFSAHGLPVYYLMEGDPYPFLISQTVAKIFTHLHRTQDWIIAYQSAVGPFKWLEPATEKVLHALATEGKKKVLIIPIAFVGDHIETTCEIDMEYRQLAQEAGITDYRMSKAIECHPRFIEALADTVEASLNKGLEKSSLKTLMEPANV